MNLGPPDLRKWKSDWGCQLVTCLHVGTNVGCTAASSKLEVCNHLLAVQVGNFEAENDLIYRSFAHLIYV